MKPTAYLSGAIAFGRRSESLVVCDLMYPLLYLSWQRLRPSHPSFYQIFNLDCTSLGQTLFLSTWETIGPTSRIFLCRCGLQLTSGLLISWLMKHSLANLSKKRLYSLTHVILLLRVLNTSGGFFQRLDNAKLIFCTQDVTVEQDISF